MFVCVSFSIGWTVVHLYIYVYMGYVHIFIRYKYISFFTLDILYSLAFLKSIPIYAYIKDIFHKYLYSIRCLL